MKITTLKDFYTDIFGENNAEMNKFLENNHNQNIGHFNIFDIETLQNVAPEKFIMPYNRRAYYKISLIKGKNKVEYADRMIDIDKSAILFATPKIPYRYISQDQAQSGCFCVFDKDFITKANSGLIIDEVPIFNPNSDFVYQITPPQTAEFEFIFAKMQKEIHSEYIFKYDLLRNYVIELIHLGQKLKPITPSGNSINASTRIFTLFIELLERQFPISSPTQILHLKTAKMYADILKVHTNHLNKILKEITGKTTSEIIAKRIAQEGKELLTHTTWNVSEIAFSLGFEEVAHFSNFFKKQTNVSPLHYRTQLFDFYK